MILWPSFWVNGLVRSTGQGFGLAFGSALLLLAGGEARAQAVPSSEVTAPTPAPSPAPASPPAKARLDAVEVKARRSATEERRVSTAGKIVIDRDEIEQFGDMTLADVMKRLPSVSVAGRPGRGGQIRMRGMGNGYTQILIDGERIPRGFSIDQLSPDLVERIEIYRAPTAETGARAIAGTINIVLREPMRQRGDDLRFGLTEERGRVQPNLAWTRNDTLGDSGTYNLTLSASHGHGRTDTATDTTYTRLASGQLDLAQSLRAVQRDEKNSLHLSSRLQWQLGKGDQFSLQPFLSMSEGHTQVTGTLSQPVGDASAPYATSVSAGGSHSATARLVALLKTHLDDATRAELRASVGRSSSNTDTDVVEYGSDLAQVLDQFSTTTIDDRSWTLTGKLSRTVADQHSLVAGFETEGVNRSETALTLIDGIPSIPGFGGDISASTRRLAGYLQDEWDPSREWSANAGLRWESIETRSRSIGEPVDNRSTVLAPLFHAVWRFDAPARDQLRFSVTRSYRTPTLQNLVSAPRLSTLYPAPGPNTASSPDRAGTPELRPELATGFDLALEHYLSSGGVVSMSAFRRNIEALIRNVTSLETVPWAVSQRWVARPQNIGNAFTQGIEFDAKFRLEELVAGALPLTLRTNLSVYGSSVSGVPGPYNRVDQQPRATANVGGDYRFRGWPVTVGGNINWIPPYTVQLTVAQSQSFQLTRVADFYALWAINASTKMRLSLSNLVPRNYVTGNSIVAGGQSQVVVSNGPTYRVVGLRLEVKV